MKLLTRLKKLRLRVITYLGCLLAAVILIHGCGEGTLPPPPPPGNGIVIITGAAV